MDSRNNDPGVAGRALNLLASPRIVTTDVLPTLRTGEFNVGHISLAFWIA